MPLHCPRVRKFPQTARQPNSNTYVVACIGRSHPLTPRGGRCVWAAAHHCAAVLLLRVANCATLRGGRFGTYYDACTGKSYQPTLLVGRWGYKEHCKAIICVRWSSSTYLSTPSEINIIQRSGSIAHFALPCAYFKSLKHVSLLIEWKLVQWLFKYWQCKQYYGIMS